MSVDPISELSAPSVTSRSSKVSLTFETLTFSDGTTLHLDESDIVVFVGPNNVGKSQALRELEHFVGQTEPQRVISNVTTRRTGTVDDLRSHLKQISRKVIDGGNLHYQGLNYDLADKTLEVTYNRQPWALRGLFCSRIGTDNRLQFAREQPSIDLLKSRVHHPIQLLYADDSAARRITTYFRRAFGRDIFPFHGAGSVFPLLVGDWPTPDYARGEDRVSATYREKVVASSGPIEEEGDGMRSFAAVILALLSSSNYSVLLLDEPEAFLHPPQARLLGEFIARERPTSSQLFIATHSVDVLQGLMGVASASLRIVRISRDGAVNRIKELGKSRTQAIAADPLMQYSDVLSGIFHARAIICESDADCMFYRSILSQPSVHDGHEPDVVFVHASGKHRMGALCEALRALGVRTDLIVDIDVLRDEPTLKKVCLQSGVEWEPIESNSRALRNSIEQMRPTLNSGEIKEAIQQLLNATPDVGEFPKPTREAIDAVFRKASPWDSIKQAGEAAIPAGQPTQQFNDIAKQCSQSGMWIVRVGELEGFCRSIGRHGPRWVQEVLANRTLDTDPELKPARDFMGKIWRRTT